MGLRNGGLGLYFPFTCGASCGASVLVLQIQGIVYTISVKAGSLREVLDRATPWSR